MSKSFADLGLSQPIVRALADRGMQSPFAIQALVIEDVLDGVDVLAKSPTGSGKTIAFAAPIVDVLDAGGRRQAPQRRRRLRRRRLRQADQERPRRPPRGRDAGPPRGSPPAPRAVARG